MSADAPSSPPQVRGLAWAGRTEEVRLAMGWNGGVSLAVWMGGVAVELDEARRAVPDAVATPAPASSTAELYAALCRAFDRRLVIDILAGASAGGLNGALLAGAIVHGVPLGADFLRGRWLEMGDFGKLLQPLENQKPASVMQGDVFLAQMREAFRALLGTDGPPPAAAGSSDAPVLLDIQVTNVVGEERVFLDDWDQPFYALEFRAPVRFRKPGHYLANSLATAARASASFPGAFEPQEISDEVAELAGLAPHTRWAIDGGLLENAPIRPAIELIPHRPASAPVKRYVCYVNASPSGHRELHGSQAQPDFAQVMGYTINLPRDGRVVDQLQALDDAARHTGLTADSGVKLLALEADALRAAALALLSTYQRRRALLSLEAVMSGGGGTGAEATGPGRGRAALKALAADAGDGRDLAAGAALLPWIPTDLEPPATPSGWRWGVRAAQRILQLELDVLRAVLLAAATDADAAAVFEGRKPLDDAIAGLELEHAAFVSPTGEVAEYARRLASANAETRAQALRQLQVPSVGAATAAAMWLRTATEAFYAALRKVSGETLDRSQVPPLHALFGLADDAQLPERLGEAEYRAFLRRAFGVEVIRRSFADDFDIEAAQTLHVAQLTPLIPAPLLDRGRRDGPRSDGEVVPASLPPLLGPLTKSDKLAGVRLNHFAGFYRRSWRANDFMWGRLDGGAVIARLLVDTDRAKALQAIGKEPWTELAAALVPTGETEEDRDRVALLEELVPPGEAALDVRLATALRDDLTAADGTGELTRAVVARALQYAALREEVPHILQAAKDDRAAGAHRWKLGWPDSGSFSSVIGHLRSGRDTTSLPGLLGAGDRDESTSALALRTISQTFLVALSALGGSGPLTHALGPARVPLLAIRSATALRPLDRLAVVLGFTGATWYVSSRLVLLSEQDTGTVPLGAVWSAPVLAAWVCMLAVAGLVFVPAVRALRSRNWKRRAYQAAFAVALLACGGGVIFGYQVSERGPAAALTAWQVPRLVPTALLFAVVGVAGLHAASSIDTIMRIAGLLHRPVRNLVSTTSLALGALGAALAFFSAKHGLLQEWDDSGWEKVGVILAFAAPAVALWYVRIWAGWRRPH